MAFNDHRPAAHRCRPAEPQRPGHGTRERCGPNASHGMAVLGAISLQYRLRGRSGELHKVSDDSLR